MTRYQSDPGQATSYMIGQLEIKKARKYSEDKLADQFSLRDFHYQVSLLVLALAQILTDKKQNNAVCLVLLHALALHTYSLQNFIEKDFL